MYNPQHYARALLGVLEDKSEIKKKEIISRFLKLISARGEFKNLGLILRELERQHLKASRFKKVFLEFRGRVAREVKEEIKEILGKDILLFEKNNPRLLAGIKILINDEILIDASVKSQLRRLFRSS